MAFEAVSRHGSVTKAARDLNLTQSTLSRLVRTLEAQLGLDLFVRQRKRLIPTEAALAYQKSISGALDMIQRASMTVVTNPDSGALSLAVLPTFGTRWLASRLSGFLEANPGIAINLATRIQRFSFSVEPFDAAIFYGESDWPDARHLKLFDERLTACASPEFLARHPVNKAEDIQGLTRLQLESRPGAWPAWFLGQGWTPPQPSSGMLMDQFSMMIQAAISGLGIALLPDYLAQIEIKEGRLNPLLKAGIQGPGGYWLAWPEEKDSLRPLRAFCLWLEDQATGSS